MKKILLALTVVACVVPVFAFAADPAPRSSFQYCENKNRCPLGFKTNKSGTKIKKLSMYNRCSQVPVEGGYPKIRVNDEGKFSKSGTVTDVIGQELTYTIKGKFRKPGKAVGTYEIDSRKGAKRCDSDPEEFVAKRVEQ